MHVDKHTKKLAKQCIVLLSLSCLCTLTAGKRKIMHWTRKLYHLYRKCTICDVETLALGNDASELNTRTEYVKIKCPGIVRWIKDITFYFKICLFYISQYITLILSGLFFAVSSKVNSAIGFRFKFIIFYVKNRIKPIGLIKNLYKAYVWLVIHVYVNLY